MSLARDELNENQKQAVEWSGGPLPDFGIVNQEADREAYLRDAIKTVHMHLIS